MRTTATMLLALILAAVPATAGEWWIPATAHADGAQGSVWRTDLVVHNFGGDDQNLTITLLPQGQDNSDLSRTASLTVAAGDTVDVADVVDGLFAFGGTAALKIEGAGDQLVVTTRTYNLGTGGTFGQSIPAVTSAATQAAQERTILMGLSGTDGQRTNVGWVSLANSSITVTVDLFSGTGQLLASRNYVEAPYGQTQINDVFSNLAVAPVGNAYARITATGRVQPYASVVAGGSNDPVYIAAQGSLNAGIRLMLPAVVHAAGASDTSWRTDGWFLNTGSRPADIAIELWLQGQENPGPERLWLNLEPGQQLELTDLVLETLGLNDAQGALVVRADQPILATSRTYNTSDTGTFGQFIPAQTLASLSGVAETQYLTGAVHSADFRTNLGLVSTSADSRVELVLRGDDGSVLSAVTRTLGLNEQLQTSLTSLFGMSDFESATVEATMVTADNPAAVLAAYLSVVDNHSSDPTFAQAARGVGPDPDPKSTNQTVLVTTHALSQAVDNSGPQVFGTKTLDCATVDYSGDTLLPGQSPEGACWEADTSYADCSQSFAVAGWTISLDGVSAADVCVLDEYPSALTITSTTAITDLDSGDTSNIGLDADLSIAFGVDGSFLDTAQLFGSSSLAKVNATIDSFVDLEWDVDLTGLETIPTGGLSMTIPFPTEAGTIGAEVTATFDGTENVLIRIRVGFQDAAYYLNLVTGAMTPA